MQIGYDGAGKVWITGDAVPTSWNNIALTVLELSSDQLAAYQALPDDRAGTMFDGKTFTPIAAAPAVAAPATISDGQLANLLISKGIITQADVNDTLSSAATVSA